MQSREGGKEGSNREEEEEGPPSSSLLFRALSREPDAGGKGRRLALLVERERF